jgi:hypothetical protein
MEPINKTSLLNFVREEERKKAASSSYYDNQAPATEDELDKVIGWLASNYDKKKLEFWETLTDILIEEKWSYERIKYAAKRLMYNVKFQTWTVAEFMEMDRTIDKWTGAEAEIKADHNRELAYANFGTGWFVCYKEDAERLQLEHKPWRSDKQLKRKVEDYD